MPRSLWLSRDWAKMRSLASSMAWRSRRANGSRSSGLGGLQRAGDGLDRHLRGHLAGGGAAHAVAHQEQGPLGSQRRWPAARSARCTRAPVGDVGDEEVVLVVLADEAHVGLAERRDPDVGRVIHALDSSAKRSFAILSRTAAARRPFGSGRPGTGGAGPQPDERSVRAAQVRPACTRLPLIADLGVPARQELVVAEHDVALLPAQGHLGPGQVIDVPAGPRRGQLPQPRPRGASPASRKRPPRAPPRAAGSSPPRTGSRSAAPACRSGT